MSESNKVLEVSYGTFACRLEGFDDSVATMKAVVSYFHELAGHERFIDMEPQLPDSATLTKIAQDLEEQDVSVDAEDGLVSLRAGLVEDAITDEEVEDIDAPSDDFEEDLVAIDAESEEEEFDEDDVADLAILDGAQADDFEDDQDDDDDDADETAQDDTSEDENHDDDADDDADVEEDDAPAAAAALEESVASKLQRIRTVVGKVETDAPHQQTAASDADMLRAAFDDDIAEEAIVDDFEFGQAEAAQDDAPEEKVDEEARKLSEAVAQVEREISRRHSKTQSRVEQLPKSVDNEMGRMMDKADDQLNDATQNRRHNAISQLKAAVAATEAARSLGDKGTSEQEAEQPFRDDLRQATRPLRLTDPAPQDETPKQAAEPEQAPEVAADHANAMPLKLVASQMVESNTSADHPADSGSAAMRLRKIASVKENTGTKHSDFASFAANVGASELHDLLEAAAAYSAFVEGDEDFSRPHIMKMAQSVASTEFSREDGLRAFGMLLRQGRVNKLSNGRFQISADTKYRPADQAAQG